MEHSTLLLLLLHQMHLHHQLLKPLLLNLFRLLGLLLLYLNQQPLQPN
jgi:hypothetical protein